MAPVRVLHRKIWYERLRAVGCRPAKGEEELPVESAEWWLTKHGFLFPVPCDGDLLRSDDLQQVFVQIAKLKPLDLDS